MRFEPDAPLLSSVGGWLPDVVPGQLADELALLLTVAAAENDEHAGRLSIEQGVVLDLCMPGWRDPAVRCWLGVTA